MIKKFIVVQAFLNLLFLVGINPFVINRNNSGLVINRNQESLNETITESPSLRKKRQFNFNGGLAMGFGAYDYYNYYGDLVSDYSYDYYDWICSETSCQLCDILTSECCDPDVDVNCFLPDTCINNPCLSGGTCITSKTLDDRPDFVCVCLPGLTGKYCQLVNDYFVGAERLALAMLNPTAVLGGLGGLGLSIPTGQGAPPIPPILAVLSEIQNRLAPPPPPPPPPPPSAPMNTTESKKENENNQKPLDNQNNVYQNAYTQSSGYNSQQGYLMNNQQNQYSYQKPGNLQRENVIGYQTNSKTSALNNIDNSYMMNSRRQPQNLVNNQPYSNYKGNSKNNSGTKVLGAKRIPCPEGQIYNSEKEKCMNFSLKKKTENLSQTLNKI